jgi:hypothetical protein
MLHDIKLESIDFVINVVEINDVTEVLEFFDKYDGLIPKNDFYDRLYSSCIENISDLLSIGFDSIRSSVDLDFLREELVTGICTVNPNLDYRMLVITEGKVVLKTEDMNEFIPLCENIKWNEDTYDRDEAPAFTVKNIWWDRLREYVEIRKYSSDDFLKLIGSRCFHSRVSFSVFVVTTCVVDFETQFKMLEDKGITERVTSPKIMQEFYEMCLKCNPFMTYDNMNLLTNEDESKPKTRVTGAMGEYMEEAEEEKGTFKDVKKSILVNLAKCMKTSIIGQDSAVDSVVSAVQRASVGLKDPVKPIGSFIFAGRSGQGKTLCAKVLSKELMDHKNLITIDCSEYAADHEYSKLIGAAPSYIGYENGGILTNAVTKNPFSVIVFDEVEKASSKVHQLLLQVLDEGRLTDNKGETVSFKDTVIIMTSNIGVDKIDNIKRTVGFGDVNVITEKKKDSSLEAAIKEKFKPEFINRVDEIIYFNDLKKKDFERIIDIELDRINENLQANDTEYSSMTLSFDTKVRNVVYKEGIDADYGARPLKRAIEKIISTPLAIKLLHGEGENDASVVVSAKRGKILFSFESKVNDPPFYVSADA